MISTEDPKQSARFSGGREPIPVYFDSFASEGLLEFWRHSDLDEHRIRFEVADRAVDWMLTEAEKSLAHLGRKRLTVLAPQASTLTATDMVEAEQRYAVDVYAKKLDEAEREAATLMNIPVYEFPEFPGEELEQRSMA